MGEGLRVTSSSFTKTAVGTKKRVPSVFELLAAGGHQRERLTKLEGMGPEACQLGPSQASTRLTSIGKLMTRAIAARVQTLSSAMKIPEGVSPG